MRSRVVQICTTIVGIAALSAACSSSSKPHAVKPTTTGAGATTTVAGPTTTLAPATPNEKAEQALLEPALHGTFPNDCQFAAGSSNITYPAQVHYPPPVLTSTCNAFNEVIILNVFASTTTRDAFVKGFTTRQCARSTGGPDGFNWALRPTSATLVPSQDGAALVASLLHGHFYFSSCKGVKATDLTSAWNEMNAVSTFMGRAGLACGAPVLDTSNAIYHDGLVLSTKAKRLAGLYGHCSQSPTTLLASIDPAVIAAASPWPAMIKSLCAQYPSLWSAHYKTAMALTPDRTQANTIAAKIGGSVDNICSLKTP